MPAPQTVVITGATGGVGRAIARVYADRGANVALLARGEAGLAAAAREVEEGGGKALPIQTDVADAEQVYEAARRTEKELGPIDVWINDAMVTVLAPVWEVTAEEYKRVTDVNYLGVVHGTLAALEHMRPRHHGTIINVGSALAYRGIPLQSAYCASKHAIVGFTESLTAELIHEKSPIKLGLVHLPGLNTPQFRWGRVKLENEPQPVPPIYQPEVAAEAIVWAADNGRRETWVAGSTFMTIWGNRVARPLVARYLGRTGFSSQQTDTPLPEDRRDNLYEPLDDTQDHGAHGVFDDKAHGISPVQKLSENRGKVAAAVAAAAAGVAAVVSKRR